MAGQSILERIERFTLRSAAGTPYTISVSRPEAKRADGKLPIFLVLDADFLFGGAAETVGIAYYGQAIVVGVGFGASYLDAVDCRMRDFQPSGIADASSTASDMADQFLSFITNIVLPDVISRNPDASEERTAIFGHSLMGFFVAYVLLHRPEAFSSYLISSPALWWDEFLILREMKSKARQRDIMLVQPEVFICVGGREEDRVTALPNHPSYDIFDLPTLNNLLQHCRMVSTAADFAKALDVIGLNRVEHHVFDAEDHMSVVPSAIARSARFVFAPD